MKKGILFLCPFVLVLLISGCSATIGQQQSITLKDAIRAGDYTQAASIIESEKASLYTHGALMYWLDKGIVAHHAGKYNDSIKYFDMADKIADELTPKRDELLYSATYPGENYELVYINLFQALNYVFVGQYDEALVEARKADHKLRTLAVNSQNKSHEYTEDPFARYLLGLIYEDAGEPNDAFISYKMAIDGYTASHIYPSIRLPPVDLVARYIKVGDNLGFKQEVLAIRSKYPGLYNNINVTSKAKISGDDGEVVLLHFNGFAPYKVNHYEQVPVAANVEGIQYAGVAMIALPQFVSSQNTIQYAQISLYAASSGIRVYSAYTYPAENIEHMAFQTLENRLPLLRARAIVAANIDFRVKKEIEADDRKRQQSKDYNFWDSLWQSIPRIIMGGVAHSVIAGPGYLDADKSSWRTLPKEVNMAAGSVPEGVYYARIDFYGQDNSIIRTKTVKDINVISGRKTFILIRTAI